LADDTEVFFGQVDPSLNIYPNVLFVMDTSGSMNSRDGGSTTRLERMKSAIGAIVDNAANINIGLMRFNGFNSGGSVLFPVTPIDEELCIGDNCGDITLVSQIKDENSDAEQSLDSDVVTPNGNILSMGRNSAENEDKQLVGYRFDELNIPQGATITSAVIDFVAQSDSKGDSELIFQIEKTDDATIFQANDKNISDRPVYGDTVDWKPEVWTANETYTTVDLSNLVQQVVNRPNWCGGNALGFRIIRQRCVESVVRCNQYPSKRRLQDHSIHSEDRFQL